MRGVDTIDRYIDYSGPGLRVEAREGRGGEWASPGRGPGRLPSPDSRTCWYYTVVYRVERGPFWLSGPTRGTLLSVPCFRRVAPADMGKKAKLFSASRHNPYKTRRRAPQHPGPCVPAAATAPATVLHAVLTLSISDYRPKTAQIEPVRLQRDAKPTTRSTCYIARAVRGPSCDRYQSTHTGPHSQGAGR